MGILRDVRRTLAPRRRLMRFWHLDGYNLNDVAPTATLVGRMRTAPSMEPVEVEVPQETLRRLLAQTQKSWTIMGTERPHNSVLTRITNFDAEGMDDFDATGRLEVLALRTALERAGLDAGKLDVALEFGCGTGRMTKYLAKMFPKVIALDVSEPHLEIAKVEAKAPNTTFRKIDSVEELAKLPPIDLFVSVIVLQHNPPPVIKATLDHILPKVRPGGAAYFQVPTYMTGYRFQIDEYLAGAPGSGRQAEGEMEMHVLPQRVVFETLRRHGFELVEVQEDDRTDSAAIVSNTFLAVRPA
jgi:2-polyprenyl-3-methyl-5-hydroxy-6-metoxy-1,4-benzoquinol methylase